MLVAGSAKALIANNLVTKVSYAELNTSLTYQGHESLTSADRIVLVVLEPSSEYEVWNFLKHVRNCPRGKLI